MKALMPIIAFAVAFGLGGGAGAVMTRPVAADSTAADSTHGAAAPGDSTHAAPGEHAPAAAGEHATLTPNTPDLEPPADPHLADAARAPGAAAPSTGPDAHGGESPAPTSGRSQIQSLMRSGTGAVVSLRADGTIGPNGEEPAGPDYQRLSRLLSRMDARGAAKTLEQLPADQAARALAMMNDKTAAGILQQLAPEKAASLLQAVLTLVPKAPAP